MLPSGRVLHMPGSVPLGIQENDTRSSITRKNGRSAAVLTALTGKSAACAKPPVASVASDSAAAATAFKRNDILNTRKFGHVKMNVPGCDTCADLRECEASTCSKACRFFRQRVAFH